MKYDKGTRELLIEAAAQALYLCLSLAAKWRNGSPPHRDKATIYFVSRLTDGLLGEPAGYEVMHQVETGFAEVQAVIQKTTEVKF